MLQSLIKATISLIKRGLVMSRIVSVFMSSIIIFTMTLAGLFTMPENAYAADSFSDQVQCFKRSKTQKGKVFKARSDEAKLKIGEISPSRNIKEIELFDAATKQKVKRNVGEYNKGDVISYFNLKKIKNTIWSFR